MAISETITFQVCVSLSVRVCLIAVILRPRDQLRSIVMSMSVCVSDCLSVTI